MLAAVSEGVGRGRGRLCSPPRKTCPSREGRDASPEGEHMTLEVSKEQMQTAAAGAPAEQWQKQQQQPPQQQQQQQQQEQ